MRYAFTAEVKTKDSMLHSYFESNDARDCRSAWQGISAILRDLKFACMIEDYSMKADNNTANAWEENNFI